METIHLAIPQMKSQHCQLMVSDTVKALGAEVYKIGPAEIELTLTNRQITPTEIVTAIEQAGYKVSSTSAR